VPVGLINSSWGGSPIEPWTIAGGKSGGMYNGMIAPLQPFAIRGAIWYQGESNAGGAWEYRTLFPAMIRDWRQAWGEGDFPFYFVQLANFTPAAEQPGESDWAELRDAQFSTLCTLPATGMALAIDIGDAGDIHPKNKQEVGRRLSLWALSQVYGKQVECSGPLYIGAKVEDGRIRVSFDHLGGGLVAQDGPLKRFAIAGEDRKWVWGDAVIDGETVVVSSPQVAKPMAVRYAWAHNPDGCNLYNKAGLPASPFRTDDWPAVTDHH
jgi:sialate O-acetylesterase